MDLKTAIMVFSVVFVAELGDKTQLATLLFSSDKTASKLTVFVSASLALVLSVGIAVLAGKYLSEFISATTLRYIAGVGFLAIGAWTLITANSVS
jgi:putative Ca2+/H+ antiporter (TMEM165/GDT1 family)